MEWLYTNLYFFYLEGLLNEKKTFLHKCQHQMISINAGHCLFKDKDKNKIRFKASEVIVVVAEHDRYKSGIWIQYIYHMDYFTCHLKIQ